MESNYGDKFTMTCVNAFTILFNRAKKYQEIFTQSDVILGRYDKVFQKIFGLISKDSKRLFTKSGIPEEYNSFSYGQKYQFTNNTDTLLIYYVLFKQWVINYAIHLKHMHTTIQRDTSLTNEERTRETQLIENYNIFENWRNICRTRPDDSIFILIDKQIAKEISKIYKSALEKIEVMTFNSKISSKQLFSGLNFLDSTDFNMFFFFLTFGFFNVLYRFKTISENTSDLFTNSMNFFLKGFASECVDLQVTPDYAKDQEKMLTDILSFSFAEEENLYLFLKLFLSVYNINLNFLTLDYDEETKSYGLNNNHIYPYQLFLPKDIFTCVPLIVNDLTIYYQPNDGALFYLINDLDIIKRGIEISASFREIQYLSPMLNSHFFSLLMVKVLKIIISLIQELGCLSTVMPESLGTMKDFFLKCDSDYTEIVETLYKAINLLLKKEEVQNTTIAPFEIFRNLNILNDLFEIIQRMVNHDETNDIEKFIAFSQFEYNRSTTVEIYSNIKVIQANLLKTYDEDRSLENFNPSIQREIIEDN